MEYQRKLKSLFQTPQQKKWVGEITEFCQRRNGLLYSPELLSRVGSLTGDEELALHSVVDQLKRYGALTPIADELWLMKYYQTALYYVVSNGDAQYLNIKERCWTSRSDASLFKNLHAVYRVGYKVLRQFWADIDNGVVWVCGQSRERETEKGLMTIELTEQFYEDIEQQRLRKGLLLGRQHIRLQTLTRDD